ncbi:MAG: TIGR04372 family glycosyltransferase, partial [Verrucomicrobiota bacterium]
MKFWNRVVDFLPERVQEIVCLENHFLGSTSTILKALRGGRTPLSFVLRRLLKNRVHRWMRGLDWAERLSNTPRGLAIGDTLSHIHCTILKTRREGKKLLLLAPDVFPCNIYYPFLLPADEYRLWKETPYRTWAIEANKGDKNFFKPGTPEKIHLDLGILNWIDSEIPSSTKLNLYKNYQEENDPIRSEAAKHGEDFLESYLFFRRIAFFYDQECDYLYRLVPQNVSGDPREYPGFSEAKLIELKKELGITSPYVCLHLRADFKGSTEVRNIEEPENYRPALEWIRSQGFQILLMGTASLHSWNRLDASWVHDLVIPYDRSEHQNLLNDLHLVSGADCMIGCCSGPTQLPFLFRKPTLWLNFIWLVGTVLLPEHRFYPKNFYTSDSKRLSLKEHLNHPIFYRLNKSDAEKYGIRWGDLSSDQILSAVREFMGQVMNSHNNWKERTERQKRF